MKTPLPRPIINHRAIQRMTADAWREKANRCCNPELARIYNEHADLIEREIYADDDNGVGTTD